MTDAQAAAYAAGVLREAAGAHERQAAGDLTALARAAKAIAGALVQGGKVLAFGNGGSAADAQHFVAELVGHYERDRPGWPAITLSADTSILTAVGNDYGYERVFARQIEALGRAGDVALGISTSGNSPNVLRALETARDRGLTTVALTGHGGRAAGLAAIAIGVREDRTPRVQEVHTTLLHVLCELIEMETRA